MAGNFSTSHKMRWVNFGNTEAAPLLFEVVVGAEITRRRGRPRKADKLTHAERVRRHSERYPLRHWARQQLKGAIRHRRIVRPDACSVCGVECKPHGHHDDYAQPLSVRWMCGTCHRAHHKSLRRSA